MRGDDLQDLPPAGAQALASDDPGIGVTQLLTWIGEGKRTIGLVTLLAAIVAMVAGLLWPKTYTAHASFLAPGTQQQSGSAAALLNASRFDGQSA